MTCARIGSIHLCHGPATEAHPTGIQQSAAYCPKCRKRRVLDLVAHVPIEPSYYGPTYSWDCPCGGRKYAPGWGE